MNFAYENIRLRELAAIADMNKEFFIDFNSFIVDRGYDSIYSFISEDEDDRGFEVIVDYLNRDLPDSVTLYDGIARPYPPNRAKWLFLGWLLRDAPEQRLRPMVSSMPGSTLNARKANLLNIVRKDVISSFPDNTYWEWHNIREVIIDRLEGSRRSLRGSLIEEIVRRTLRDIFEDASNQLEVAKSEIQLEGETYDVSIHGARGSILMPVKTRETMGGGHALLFTRDIHKSISVAHEAGYTCVPIIIAESWMGDLGSLNCEKTIHINLNPNQISIVENSLRSELAEITDYILEVCLY